MGGVALLHAAMATASSAAATRGGEVLTGLMGPGSRPVLLLGVAGELGTIEVHLAKVALAVADRLVVEMRETGSPLSAGSDRPGPDAVAELHHRHEAVPAGAVELLGVLVVSRAERRQRAPAGRGEADRNTGHRVVERLHDASVSRWKRLMSPQGVFQLPKSLSSISDAVASACSRSDAEVRVAMYSSAVIPAFRALVPILRPISSPQAIARWVHRRFRPPEIPLPEHPDLLGHLGFEGIAGRGPVVGREQGGDERLERGEIASYAAAISDARVKSFVSRGPGWRGAPAFSLPVST